MSRRNLAALGLIGIVIISSIAILVFSNDDSEPLDLGPGVSDILDEIVRYDGSLNANLNFTQENFYKGDTIPFELEVEVDTEPARLDVLTIQVRDLNLSRSANQSIQIDILVNPGLHKIPLELNPGFNLNGFVTLVNKNYTLISYQLNYTQIQQQHSISGSLNHNLFGKLNSVHDQGEGVVWNSITTINSTLSQTKNNVTITSFEENATAIIRAEIETTAYTRVYYNVSGQVNSTIQIGINNFMNITNSTSGYLPIGEYQGKHNITILFNIASHENVSIVFSIPTQKIAIMTVVANNNWEEESADGLKFREVEYYIDLLNANFSSVFNLTYVIVANVNFNSSKTSANLNRMWLEASEAVGRDLQLKDGSWHDGVGSQIENVGADIMLILSNKTMDHLGVVFSEDGNNNKNLAIAVRGSLNTGQESIDLRLPSTFADNLIQHELSHIFKAPDRWTEDGTVSVMTKSRPSDALVDFVTQNFWLMRTNWLEEDIQTMVNHFDIFLIEY